MKCVKKDSEIRRVSEAQAVEMVATKGWSYCGKKLWKDTVRVKPTAVIEPLVEGEPQAKKPKKVKKNNPK